MRVVTDDFVDEQATRRRLMAAYDALPASVREAVRQCPYDIHILRRVSPDADHTALIAAIRAISSPEEAEAFTMAHSSFRWR